MLPLSHPRPCDVAQAVAALRKGAVVGLPTDTVYGLGVDPFSREAVAALFALKGRPAVKPIPSSPPRWSTPPASGSSTGAALAAVRAHWPGALTVVVPPGGRPARLGGRPERATRWASASPTTRRPWRCWRPPGPLAVTSANRSGEAPAADEAAARAMFGTRVAAYLPGSGSNAAPSTVVDFTGATPRVLRSGPGALGGGVSPAAAGERISTRRKWAAIGVATALLAGSFWLVLLAFDMWLGDFTVGGDRGRGRGADHPGGGDHPRRRLTPSWARPSSPWP